ncbi:MAG: glycosyltransferase [Steroidobacteraceae bacterium]
MLPLVSIIMICRNGERFLDEAIDSVFSQTLQQWELVFVDDGSSDASLSIVAARASLDPGRIRVVVHPERRWCGTAASRNLGIVAARGKYVTFLDADDVYEPERLASHLACLEANPGLGVVISHDLYWRSWGRAGRRHLDEIIGPLAATAVAIPAPGLLVGTLLARGAPLPGLCSVTFRRSVLGRGIPREFVGHYEDQALLASALLRSTSMVLAAAHCRYRQHPWSLTRGNDPAAHGLGSEATMARAKFLAWLRHEVDGLSQPLPELAAWIEDEMRDLGIDHSTPMTVRFPGVAPVLSPLMRARAGWRRYRGRRQVMQHVQRLAQANPRASARAYWDQRVQDLHLSDQPAGTPGFIAAHDAYRHGKAAYLGSLLEYPRWRGCAVLDVGCGIGLDLIRFAQAGASVAGVDLSTTAVDITRRNCAAAGVKADILQGDAACLPFKDGSFDLVVAYALTSFVPDPRAVSSELLRVLKPGGTAILMAYNRLSWMGLLAPLLGGFGGHADAPFFRQDTPGSWKRLLAGFAEARTWTDRFPAEVPGGHAGTRVLAGFWKWIPARFTRNLGWHLLTVARKAG